MRKRVHIIISGRVQGIFFRAGTRKQAISLRLTGWVKNNPDNTVEIIAQGEENKLKEFLKYCHKGPMLAKVENVKVKYEKFKNEFESFSVRY